MSETADSLYWCGFRECLQFFPLLFPSFLPFFLWCFLGRVPERTKWANEQRCKEVDEQRGKGQTNKGMNDVPGGFYGALSGWFANGVKNRALFAFNSINIPIWYIALVCLLGSFWGKKKRLWASFCRLVVLLWDDGVYYPPYPMF